MSFFSNFTTFFKPDDFKSKPYGYLTNQLGHIFLGFGITTWYTWIITYLSGVYPSQVLSFFVCVTLYLVVWELIVQGWRNFDTIEDTAYFGMGSSVYLFIHMEWVIDRVSIYLLLISIPLALGTISKVNGTDE